MPDHLHLFARERNVRSCSIARWTGWWKHQIAVLLECGENRLWQKGLWDTRIYSWDSYREKLNYVMANPVRAGLVEESDAWPYQGMIHQVGWFD